MRCAPRATAALLLLPLPLPPLQAELASRGSSKVSHVKDAVKAALSQFKASHSDNWSRLKVHFTEQQLDSLEGAFDSPHYFA